MDPLGSILGVKSPSFGAKSPNFVGKNAKSPHFVTAEREDLSSQNGFSALSLDSYVDLMISALGPRTMGLYKKGVLEEFKAVQLSLVLFYAWVCEI